MQSVESLASLSPKTTPMEADLIPGTAKRIEALRGVEVSALLCGLNQLQTDFAFAKYVGENQFVPGICQALTKRFSELDFVCQWLTPNNQAHREYRVMVYPQMVNFLLLRHLKDYRCDVCLGRCAVQYIDEVGDKQTIECQTCQGTGMIQISLLSISRALDVNRKFAQRNRRFVYDLRLELVRFECEILMAITENGLAGKCKV